MRQRLAPRQRKVDVVDVEVDRVEFVRSCKQLFEHHQVVRGLVDATPVESQRPPAGRHQPRLRHRVATREQRHLVALVHQFLGEVRHDPLGAAVALRRHALVQRRDLGDLHGLLS
jgi:hypothetical protein